MDWPSVVAAGVCAGLAGGIASLLPKDAKHRRVLYAIVLVPLFFGFQAFSNRVVMPRVRLWQADQQLRSSPFYREIAQADPQTYTKILAVASKSLENGESVDLVTGRLASIVRDTLPRYVGVASDQSVIEMVDVLIKQITLLEAQKSDACYFYLLPDGTSLVPLDSKGDEDSMKAMGDVVHSAVYNPQPSPDAVRAEVILQPVIEQLTRSYGDDLQLLREKPSDSIGRHKVCKIVASLYADIEILPRSDAGLLLRYLLSNPSNSH
jgi:hypothetical protein